MTLAMGPVLRNIPNARGLYWVLRDRHGMG